VTDGRYKDIVEEVFSKSTKADNRVSSLLTRLKEPPQASLEKGEMNPCDLKESPAAKEAKYEFESKRTIKNKELIHQVSIVAVAVVFVLAFLVGGYLRQHGNDSTKVMQEKQSVNRSQMVSPLQTQPLLDVQPESVSAKIIQNSTALDWQHVINWGRLLGQISATIPKTVQLSVIESGDRSQMFLEGRALSADAVHDFADALSTNSQIKSAELTQTRIGKWNSQDLLKFSISCSLVSDTKTPANVDGDYNNSGFDRGRLFTPTEAEKFFAGTQPICEQAGCKIKSLLLSPKDAVFEDKKTNGRITKKHAVLTLLGGYQNILKAVEKLQNRPQGVWLDSVSIQEGSETGSLECSMGISVYVAEAASRKN
jgi:Tfp pilus assembly protein PilN